MTSIYTLDDFRDESRFALGGARSSSPALTDTRLDRWINQTYLWVSMPNHYRHPELETTEYLTLAADDASYALTNTYYFVTDVTYYDTSTNPPADVDVRKRDLGPMDKREWNRTLITLGEPTRYAHWNNIIYLDRAPSADIVGYLVGVDGYQQPTVLSDDTDTTVLRPEWDEVIVKGIEWRGWMWQGEIGNAEAAKEDFGRMVNEIADWQRLGGEDWFQGMTVEGYGEMNAR